MYVFKRIFKRRRSVLLKIRFLLSALLLLTILFLKMSIEIIKVLKCLLFSLLTKCFSKELIKLFCEILIIITLSLTSICFPIWSFFVIFLILVCILSMILLILMSKRALVLWFCLLLLFTKSKWSSSLPKLSHIIVLRFSIGFWKNIVGIWDGFEFILICIRILVWMILFCQFVVRLFDFVCSCFIRNTKYFVIVFIWIKWWRLKHASLLNSSHHILHSFLNQKSAKHNN